MAKHYLYQMEKRCGVRVTTADPHGPPVDAEAPLEELVEAMQFWCQETRCGRRTAYDIFEFRTEAERTMFTLKWS